jgi:hypothetical protein
MFHLIVLADIVFMCIHVYLCNMCKYIFEAQREGICVCVGVYLELLWVEE